MSNEIVSRATVNGAYGVANQIVEDQYAYLKAQQAQGLLSSTMEIDWITSPLKITLKNVSENDMKTMQVLLKSDSFRIREFKVTAINKDGKLIINNASFTNVENTLSFWVQVNESLAIATGAKIFTPFKTIANKAPVNQWIDWIGDPHYAINYNGPNLKGKKKFYTFVLSFEK